MSLKDKPFLSYHDTLLYESDLELLQVRSGWLNDRLIGFYYEFMERECFSDQTCVAFVNPSTVQLLKMCSDPDEAVICFLDPLQLRDKDLIFWPLNNSQEVSKQSGSHWSLLVFNKATLTFMHLDSMRTSSNRSEADFFAHKFRSYFKAADACVHVADFPQQQNGSDCGVYVLGATELLANHFKAANGSLPLPIDFRDITPKNITELRTKIKLLIYKLAEDQ